MIFHDFSGVFGISAPISLTSYTMEEHSVRLRGWAEFHKIVVKYHHMGGVGCECDLTIDKKHKLEQYTPLPRDVDV